MNNQTKINLLNFEFDKLTDFVESLEHKPFRARQLWQWIHQKRVADFADMQNLAQDFRIQLQKIATISPPSISSANLSVDGCIKFLFDVGNNLAIESVLIPERDRLTLCISTQAGCVMACSFCATGEQGFSKQLTLAEIVGQVWQVNKYLTTFEGELNNRVVSNIVFMGMGEPLANYKPTVAALKIFLDDNAYGLSRRRVTVSTCGLSDAIVQLAKDCPVSLAISLHAANDKLRSEIMPVNNRYPIANLMLACREYIKSAPRAKILIEYVLIKDVNDSAKNLDELANLCKDLACKINLIPFNPFATSKYKAPTAEQVSEFSKELTRKSKKVVLTRRQRGEDVSGACGQLAGKIIDIRSSKVNNKNHNYKSPHDL